MDIDIIEDFSTATNLKDQTLRADVQDFINWETDQGLTPFHPQATDDVAIRTYLLDRRIQGLTRSSLNRILASLEHFYAWLTANAQIPENPFKKFNLKRAFRDLKYLLPRHDAFTGKPDEREIARLRALNRLAESTNQAPDVQSLLNATLQTMLGVTTLQTAWISLKNDNGLLGPNTAIPPKHGFFLAATHNLPPSLERSDRLYLTRPPECHCQQLLRTGRLKRGVNVVECSRLQDSLESQESNAGLLFHASVPITINQRDIGIMNFAAAEWQLLSASDLQFLTAGARQLGSALERAHLYDVIRIEHHRQGLELDLARKMQVSLLPSRSPEIAGYGVASFWQPAHETSGDYYNFFKLPGGRWGFIIADVCGKGAPAAIRMAMTHSLVRERVEKEFSPAALLGQVNRSLCEQAMDMQFVTSIYAVLDPLHHSLKYAIAGHPPPFLRRASGQVEKLPGRGIVLGVDRKARYEDLTVSLSPGDSLVAFTDGVTDASSPANQSYDMDQLQSAIASAPARPTDLLAHLRTTLVDWVKEAPNFDDITLLALGRKPLSDPPHAPLQTLAGYEAENI